MSVVQVRPMSLEEFLAWEVRQEFKYEFDGFAPVAMVGVTVAHSVIQGNLLIALGTRLRGKPCCQQGRVEGPGCRQDPLPRRLRDPHTKSKRRNNHHGSGGNI